MQYNGIELKEITEPQIFDPPKKMCVWSEEFKEPKIEFIAAIFPQSSLLPRRVVSVTKDFYMSLFQHCAEIPEEPKLRKATYRELAKWLVQGNGEMTFKSKSESDIDHIVFSSHHYEEEFADEECAKALKRADDGSWIVVRKWEDTEWHEPTAEYMGIE